MNDEDNVTGGDLAKSITFEVAANTLLDKYSGLLLAAPDPTAISKFLYGVANVGGSAAINYFAQRMRGGKFNLGELLTAGGLSLIPGGVQAKTLSGRVVKGTGKGAGLGALQVTGESLINEGKPPDLEDVALGATFGGGLGGVLSGVSGPETAKFARALKNRLKRKKLVVQEIQEQVAQQKPQKNLGGYMEDEGIDIEDYGFGPEGPRGGATDEQIMQAYRERTGELDLDPRRRAEAGNTVTANQNQGLNFAQKTPPATQTSSPYYNWGKFGYKSPARTLPTQVRKVLGTDLQDEVALSLWNQYNRADDYLKRTGSLKGFGEKFVNPANGKLYYIQRTRGKNPRLTLQSVEKKLETVRRRREKDVASTPVQDLLKRFKTKDIKKLNEIEAAKFEEATAPIKRKIQLYSTEIHRYNQYPDIQESIAAQIAEEGKKLDAILEGYHYGEHGHAIRSKVWDYVKRIKRFANQKLMFKAGDGKNFHIVFEPNKRNQQFKKLKDDFELIIESTIGEEQKRYPDVIVNYNPVLSGPGKKIRFEKLSTLKVGFKSRQGKRYPDMMYGDLIAEYDVDKLGVPTPAQMQKWLDENLPGEKLVGKKATIDKDFKKTRRSVPKIEDLTLKQSKKKRLK